MSNNHVKEPGSFTDIPLNPGSSDFKKPQNSDSTQSGWKNYPKEIANQGNKMASPENNNSDEILEKILAENILPESSDTNLPQKTDAKTTPDEIATSITAPEEVRTDIYPQPQAGYPNHPLDATHHHSANYGELAISEDTTPKPHVFSASDHTAVELADDKEPLKVEALERWLDKPVPEKENSSMLPVFISSAAVLLIVSLTYIGVYITGSYKTIDGPLMHIASLFGAGADTSGISKHTKISTQSPHGGSEGKGASNNGSGSDNGGSDGTLPSKKKVAAAIIAAPTLKTQGINCSEPNIKLSPLPGGRTQIALNSPCRSNEKVNIEYSNVRFSTRFDNNGVSLYELDAFAGANLPITFKFEDGGSYERHPVLSHMNDVSKVAIVWDSPININLHAFEYAAGENSQGHIWEENPKTLSEINNIVNTGNTGRGFISSAGGASQNKKTKVEVYTFLHSPKQKNGVVKLALDYDVKTSGVQTVSCTNNNPAYVNYKTIRMIKNRTVEQHEGQLLIDLCKPVTQRIYISKAVQDLDISN